MVQVGNVNIGLPSINWGSIVSTMFWGMLSIIAVGIIIWWIYSFYKNKSTYNYPVTLTQYFDNGTHKTIAGLKGGKFTNKHGVFDFRIKVPKTFKKKELGFMPDFSKADADQTLHFITVGDNSVWQQVEHKLVIKERKASPEQIKIINEKADEEAKRIIGILEDKISKGETTIEQAKVLYDQYALEIDKERAESINKSGVDYELMIKPLKTEDKIAMVAGLKRWSEMVNKQKITIFGIGLGMFIIMVIAHLISLYIQTKIRCPGA